MYKSYKRVDLNAKIKKKKRWHKSLPIRFYWTMGSVEMGE